MTDQQCDYSFESYQLTMEELSNVYNINEENKLMVYSLGLAGETGKVCELLKRYFRGDYHCNTTDKEVKNKLSKELGDVLAYLTLLVSRFEIDLKDVAKTNVSKIEKRFKDNKLLGSGSDR